MGYSILTRLKCEIFECYGIFIQYLNIFAAVASKNYERPYLCFVEANPIKV